MKVLLIDKNLIDPVNHAKWTLLAEKPGIQLVGVTPRTWVENYRVLQFNPSDSKAFPIVPLKVVWPGRENRGFYLWGLRSSMRSLSPDVVIAFEEPFSLFALQSVAAARHCVPAAPIVLYSWDNMSDGVSYPYRPKTLYRLIERWVMPRISVLLTANKEAYDRFAAMYTTPISLVYFGIDMKGFGDQRQPDRDQPKDPARFCVGYLGRLLPMKGVDTLVDALPLLPSHVYVSIVGNGPDLPRLIERVRNQRGENRVAFQRGVNSERVKDILSTFDVLVLPSRTTPRWKEQYGRVLIEAMASGVPVIGSDSGAIPEVIGDAGLIYPEGDARALAHSIQQFLSDDGLRDRLSRAGMRRAQQFSAVTFAEEMYRLLRGLAGAQ